jgi:hypothetical protein
MIRIKLKKRLFETWVVVFDSDKMIYKYLNNQDDIEQFCRTSIGYGYIGEFTEHVRKGEPYKTALVGLANSAILRRRDGDDKITVMKLKDYVPF